MILADALEGQISMTDDKFTEYGCFHPNSKYEIISKTSKLTFNMQTFSDYIGQFSTVPTTKIIPYNVIYQYNRGILLLGGKMILQLSYLHNGISCTGEVCHLSVKFPLITREPSQYKDVVLPV